MIKKILGSLLFLTGFFSFSYGAKVEVIGLDSFSSSANSNFNITAMRGGSFLTNFLGVGKSVLAFNNQTLMFRHKNNGLPYYYHRSTSSPHYVYQGYFGSYYLCSQITGNNYSPNNCTSYSYNGDYDSALSNFFYNVNAGDYFYYDTAGSRINICWSSSTIGSSFCLRYSNCTHAGNSSCNSYGELINSNDYDTGFSFSTITNDIIGYAPGQNGYNGNRDNEENNTNTSTNNNYVCPTIAQVMKNMGENYNTGLCYNNTSYFNGTNFVQIEKEDIFTIFNDDYQNYTNRISIYRNNCTNTNTTQACQNAFSGEYKKYSIISNAINSNVDEKKLRNYCNLGLNYDPNATTCVASGGGIKEEYTTEETINNIINNGIIPTPNTNQQTTGENQDNVLNALNKCESGDRECYVNNRNFIDSLKNIYGKITGLFKERNGVDGIIPNYILRITFLTILFTVIFKK